MDRFPAIITIGAGLLGWVAGEMAVTDPSVTAWMANHQTLHTLAPIAGAVLVVALGKWLWARNVAQQDLVRQQEQPAN